MRLPASTVVMRRGGVGSIDGLDIYSPQFPVCARVWQHGELDPLAALRISRAAAESPTSCS